MKLDYNFTVLLDIDDVVHDFHSYINGVISEKSGIELTSGFQPTNYDYTDVIPNFREIFNALPDDWPMRLAVLPGAVEFVDRIRARGGKIVLITSVSTKLVPARLRALRNSGIRYDEAYFTYGSKKSEFVNALADRLVGPVLFVDDYLKNCNDIALNTAVRMTFCLDAPYNGEVLDPGIKVFSDLNSLFIGVIEQIDYITDRSTR